ncbi:CBS domain-containing protein [Streptomyces sp. RP5T]|uniref:CBS domain-containing protein n=1 Tax=unclassified Streptomyces TaxID=2593676 RepID=UPI000F653C47|nr:CBS domain-containing protein [Streptomyces sp. RP5T]RRR86111.1 CBS domain-containing protein [Streptomyces sp. RP5T]
MKATKIGAVMVADVVTADRDTPFKEVARLLGEHRISGLPVVDEDDHVLGVISETDLLLRQARAPHARRWRGRRHGIRGAVAKSRARTAAGLMSAPAVTVPADATVPEAARLMANRRVERLPVVDEENRLVGIVTRRDLLEVFLRTDDEIRAAVEQEVFLNTLWLAPQNVTISVRNGVVTLSGVLERRTEKAIALRTTGRIDGVVGVVDRLSYRLDDTRLQPAEQALHGVADGWLRRL